MALLTEELTAHVAVHGKGCKKKVPPETNQTTSRIFNVVLKQPELGVEVKGYDAFVIAIKAAMLNDE